MHIEIHLHINEAPRPRPHVAVHIDGKPLDYERLVEQAATAGAAWNLKTAGRSNV